MMIERVNAELQKQIQLIVRDMKDPRIAEVAVSGVETAPDLSFARVYVSIAENQEEALSALNKAAAFVRNSLKSAVLLRRIPELRFIIDSSKAYGDRIEELLFQINKKQGSDDNN